MGISLYSDQEAAAIETFSRDGYIVFNLEDREHLERIKRKLFDWSRELVKIPDTLKPDDFFDSIQNYIEIQDLNRIRVGLISRVGNDLDLRTELFLLAKNHLHWICGNEIAIQRTSNLSIQVPQDASSLLPLHSDVWSGNSPYEVVLWFPFVDVYRTKSMYILPLEKTMAIMNDFPKYARMSADELFKTIEQDVIWLDIPYGHGLIFSHTLLHGNVVNQEKTTRWSFNNRFKALLSPYGSKEIGESFVPLNIRPLTRIGHQYRKPAVKGAA